MKNIPASPARIISKPVEVIEKPLVPSAVVILAGSINPAFVIALFMADVTVSTVVAGFPVLISIPAATAPVPIAMPAVITAPPTGGQSNDKTVPPPIRTPFNNCLNVIAIYLIIK
jgi:hypothetical protein